LGGDVVDGIDLSHFGEGYLVLGTNSKRKFFDSSFYWN